MTWTSKKKEKKKEKKLREKKSKQSKHKMSDKKDSKINDIHAKLLFLDVPRHLLKCTCSLTDEGELVACPLHRYLISRKKIQMKYYLKRKEKRKKDKQKKEEKDSSESDEGEKEDDEDDMDSNDKTVVIKG